MTTFMHEYHIYMYRATEDDEDDEDDDDRGIYGYHHVEKKLVQGEAE
jgi:hypothetical protein